MSLSELNMPCTRARRKITHFQSRRWQDCKLWVGILILVVLALPGAVPRYIGQLSLVATPTPGSYAVVRDVPWFFAVSKLRNILK